MYDFFNFLKAIAIVVSAFAIYMFLALLFKKDFGALKELLSSVLDWVNNIFEWINIIVSSIAKFIVELIIFGAIVGIIIFGWKQFL